MRVTPEDGSGGRAGRPGRARDRGQAAIGAQEARAWNRTTDRFTRETQKVGICKTGSEIADHIRLKVIYEGLELEDIGIDLADVTDDVRLFDEDGLNLDSIDALEILAGVQREFGLSFPNVDQAFMDEHCATVERLATLVESRRAVASADS